MRVTYPGLLAEKMPSGDETGKGLSPRRSAGTRRERMRNGRVAISCGWGIDVLRVTRYIHDIATGGRHDRI